jgi:hypothetical protein
LSSSNLLDRFLLPLILFLACLAAGAVAWILMHRRRERLGRAREPFHRRRAYAAAPSSSASVCFLRRSSSPPASRAWRRARTRSAGRGLIRNHVDASERILSTPLTVLPLLAGAEDRRRISRIRPSSRSRGWPYQRLPAERLDGDPRWRIRPSRSRSADPHGMNPARRSLDRGYARGLRPARDLRSCAPNSASGFEARRAPGRASPTPAPAICLPADVGPVEYQGARRLWPGSSGPGLGPGVRIYRMRR